MDGSLGGKEKKKKLRRLFDAGKEPEKAGNSARPRGRNAAETLSLLPAALNCGSQSSPALAAARGCPPPATLLGWSLWAPGTSTCRQPRP